MKHKALIKGVYDIKLQEKRTTEMLSRGYSGGMYFYESVETVKQEVLGDDIIELDINNPILKVDDELYLSKKKVMVKIKKVLKTDIENTVMYIVTGLYEDKIHDTYLEMQQLKKAKEESERKVSDLEYEIETLKKKKSRWDLFR